MKKYPCPPKFEEHRRACTSAEDLLQSIPYNLSISTKSNMSFLQDLNPVQREAARAVNGPVLIVAGAGSGKTRVLTFRVAYLMSIGVPAYRILALTFTNKSAGEMRNRAIQLVGEKSAQIWMGTFHSMFARILRNECERIGYTRNFTIYDTDDSLSLIKHVQRSLGISSQQFNPNAMRARISAAKNRCITPEEFARQAVDVFEEKTARVYIEYQRRLKQANAMDFDDLLVKTIELFEKNKKVLEAYQDRFHYILVDEYQDTNRAQYIALKLLADKHKNICVVGDDAQSIYAFRGAEIRNILDFEREFPDCKMFRLEQNYRSTKMILAAADHVIKNNVDQIHKTLWTENAEGEHVSLLECSDDKDEGGQIVAHLQKEILKKKLELKDFAILYRTNAQSRSLEDALRRNGIPYIIVGGVEFYKRKEIKDVLAYLRLIVNPKDDESILRIINVPTRGIGNTTIEKLQSFAGKHKLTFWEALETIVKDDTRKGSDFLNLPQSALKHLRSFYDLIQKYRSLKENLSVSEFARVLVDELGMLRELKEEGTPEALTHWENIQELLSAISEYSAENPDARLENFLEEVSLISDIDKWDETRNAVTLMTAHAAKGLEFPVVFIAGLEEGLFPFYNSILDRKELEEERRLFYVGMTRAKQRLYLSYARLRYRFGSASYQSPSRFIDEIDTRFLQVERGSLKKPSWHAASITDNDEYGQIRTVRRTKSKSLRKKVLDSPALGGFIDEQPDYEGESQVVNDFRVGAKVEHEVFRRGKIIELSGRGENAKAVVDFLSVGRKHLLLKYAHLRVL